MRYQEFTVVLPDGTRQRPDGQTNPLRLVSELSVRKARERQGAKRVRVPGTPPGVIAYDYHGWQASGAVVRTVLIARGRGPTRGWRRYVERESGVREGQ